MQSLRHLLQRSSTRTSFGAAAVFAALVAALSLATAAGAKPPAKIVTDVFAVTYDAKITFKHHKAHPEFIEEDDARVQVHGRLPDLTFVDGLLQTDQSAIVKTEAKGFAGVEVKQTDGWSLNCVATKFKVRGLAGIARVENGISFLPALSALPKGHCIDSEGMRPPFPFVLFWPGSGRGETPQGAVTFPMTPKSIDVANWSEPFRIVFEDEKCPNYEAELSILCSVAMQGKLTLTRVDRTEEVNGEVLLPALDPPKLNKAKTKVTTTIECQSGCDVEALIGVFGGIAKHPKVTPLHKKNVHLRADKPTTLSLPLNAADRAVAKQGLLVMSLQAKGGKEQVYPLALGGLPDVPGISARRGPIALAARGGFRNLALPSTATLRNGSVTVPVSNPNGFRARGSLELRLGKRSLGRAMLAIPGHGKRRLTVRIDGAGAAAIAQNEPPRVTAVLSFRDPAGHRRRTTKPIVLSHASAVPPSPDAPKGPTEPAPEAAAEPDGTYRGAGGLTIVVAAGKVTVFSGQISTYCTTSETQKNVTFGMFGDDPDPQVAADGSFAWEATDGYGFVKLKYEGRLGGSKASGNLVVEDRSPVSTDDGSLEFDYCFAGADWSATR